MKISLFVAFAAVILVTGCNKVRDNVANMKAASHGPAETPAPKPAAPSSDWEISDPQVSKMDGFVTTFISTRGSLHLALCFQSKGKCNVPVSLNVPSGCYIESNVDGMYYDYKRRVRVKFDNEAPRTEIWTIADSRDAIIPPKTQAFIGELEKHKTFIIETGCGRSDISEQEIVIAGLQQTFDQFNSKH